MAILVEDVACRVGGSSPSELSRVQAQLTEGVVGTLAKAEDAAALEAAGEQVVTASAFFFFFFFLTIKQQSGGVQTGAGALEGHEFYSHKHRGFHISIVLFFISFVKQQPDNIQSSTGSRG